VPIGQAPIQKVTIESDGADTLRLTFHVAQVVSEMDARLVCDTLAEELTEKIAFHEVVAVGRPRFSGSTLTRQEVNADGTTHPVVQAGVSIRASASFSAVAIRALSPSLLSALQSGPRTTSPGRAYYSLFRTALDQEDVLARYMACYGILLLLCGDNQAAVDACIRAEEPGVLETARPDKPKIQETVYTRLRNQVGHVRKGVTVESTRTEMDSHIGGLLSLTRVLIAKQIS